MLTIRLQRAGKRNKPEFRIVLAEKQASASKKFIEILGSYNPRTKNFAVKQDRVLYWVAQHVALSPTIHNLFVTQKLVTAPKVKAFSIPAKVEEPAAPVAPAAADATPAEVTAETPVADAAPTPSSEEPTPQASAEAPVAEPTPTEPQA